MKKKQFLIFIGILFMILALIISSTKLIIDIEWFQEVGYLKVYLTKVLAVVKLMGAIIPIMLCINISIEQKYINKYREGI